MAQPYPISRESREEAIFFGDGGAVYGPFALKIFDIDDVEVWTKADGGTWTIAAPTVAKVDPAIALDEFTITFAAVVPVTTKIKVLSARVHERSAGITAGTKLSPDALEKELTKQGTILQELRRDIERAALSEFGVEGYRIADDLADGDVLMKSNGRLVAGPNAADIAGAQGYAETAAAVAAALPPIVDGSMMVDEGGERETKTFAQVNEKLGTFETEAAASAATIDATINRVRLEGAVTLGDGLGGLYIDTDNGATDTFTSNSGARTWYRAADVGSDRLAADVATALVEAGRVESKDPILVLALGQSNMIGWTEANNGPLYALDDVYIYDTTTESFRAADLSANTYDVYCGDPGVSIKTVGGGRNSPAAGFAQRLRKEFPGRSVYIVYSATGGRNLSYWISSGRDSVDWVALNRDVSAACALLGKNYVDYWLVQHGEANAQADKTVGAYASALDTLLAQGKAEYWWGASTYMVLGEPCRSWSDTTSLNYLLAELATFKAGNHPEANVATSYALRGGSGNLYQSTSTGDSVHFRGSGLYSLGYYNYWDALPDWKTGKKRSFAELSIDLPWNASGEAKYPDKDIQISASTHLATAPLYTLAPTIAKAKSDAMSRLFVGATVNINSAGESGGTHGRVVVSDDDGATWLRGTTGGSGMGFVNPVPGCNVAEPNLWTAPDGTIWAFMTASVNGSVFDSIAGVYISVCTNPLTPSPGDLMWSKPDKVLPYGWPQKPVYLSGKWYLPVSYWNGESAVTGRHNFVPALQGRFLFEVDWVNRRLINPIHIADTVQPTEFDEMSVTQTFYGTWLATWRTAAGPYYSLSDNNGKTWSAPLPFTSLGTVVDGTAANSRHRLINTPAGVTMFCWNKSASRTNLTVALSSGLSSATNLGYSAGRLKELESGGSSYPDVLVDGDTAYVVYDDGNPGRSTTRRIRLSKFSINDLRTNAAGMVVTQTTAIPGT